VAARTLAGLVAPERLASGALYPPVSDLRSVSRAIAVAVVRKVGTVDGEPPGAQEADAAVDAAIWWPDYVRYDGSYSAARSRRPSRIIAGAPALQPRSAGQAPPSLPDGPGWATGSGRLPGARVPGR
jgi:hypothetical protein